MRKNSVNSASGLESAVIVAFSGHNILQRGQNFDDMVSG